MALFVLQLLTISARAEMTFPRVVKDLLMFAPSWLEEEKPRCPFQSHIKAQERMRNIQYGVGKEQLVLLGNQCLPGGNSRTPVKLALGSSQTHQGFWQ